MTGATRRRFLAAVGAAAAGLGLLPRGVVARAVRPRRGVPGGPVAIASGNGLGSVARALALAQAGEVPLLHAAVEAVGLVEDDPDDMSVGYGGLPNEDGVVELDAAVMDGTTHRAGAVAALRDVRHAAAVALRVLEHTDHVLLVGEGARRFAVAHGFPTEDLLTPAARERWLAWKESAGRRGEQVGGASGEDPAAERPGGTIHLSLHDGRGHVACATTTSGIAYKLAGRVGDSALVGAGLYCSDEVGSCGSTGRGEAVILEAGSFAVVEHMRRGASPAEACREVLARIARHAPARHRREDGAPDFDVRFYAVSIAGDHAGASLHGRGEYAVADPDGGARLLPCLPP